MRRRFRAAWPGLLSGLAGVVAMTLVSLLLRLLAGVSPLVESVPDRLAPLIPVDLFLRLLGVVGGYNQLKAIGLGSGLLGQTLAGLLGGVLYAAAVERGQARDGARNWRRGQLVVCAGVLLVWLASLLLIRPVLSASYRGLPPSSAFYANAVGLLITFATYGVAVMLAYRYVARGSLLGIGEADAGGELAGAAPLRRRAFLTAGAAGFMGLGAAGLLGVLYRRSTFGYDGLQYRGAAVEPIAPNDRFYVVTKNVVDPIVSRSAWALEVKGLVENPRRYDYAALSGKPSIRQETTLMCISNGVGGGRMSNAVWTGAPLRTLLDEAGPRPGVREVVLHGADGYTDTFAFEKAASPSTLVAYEMNGEPLPHRHGYPVRVIVPGLFGEKNVKWVTGIELVGEDAAGFYEQQGWGPDFSVPTHSRFDAPDFGEPLPRGEPVELKGIAFAGDRGVGRVEVSVDGERSWREAELTYTNSALAWSLWRYEWRPERAGTYRLAVRAADRRGAPQSPATRSAGPEGATGYHRVMARVTG